MNAINPKFERTAMNRNIDQKFRVIPKIIPVRAIPKVDPRLANELATEKYVPVISGCRFEYCPTIGEYELCRYPIAKPRRHAKNNKTGDGTGISMSNKTTVVIKNDK